MDLMSMLCLDGTKEWLDMANSVCLCIEERGWSCLEKGIRF